MKISYWDLPKLKGTTFIAPGAGHTMYKIKAVEKHGVIVQHLGTKKTHIARIDLILKIVNQ